MEFVRNLPSRPNWYQTGKRQLCYHDDEFTADTYEAKARWIPLVTGSDMAGKSTYMRQVAALAGLPGEVVQKSKMVLGMIEEENHITVDKLLPEKRQLQTVLFDGTVLDSVDGVGGIGTVTGEKGPDEADDHMKGGQLPANLKTLAEELKKIDVMRMTPIDALGKLYELKKLVDEKKEKQLG